MSDAKRILLVDPDELLRRSLAEALADQGFVVRQADHADHALALLADDLPDLVLMDAEPGGLTAAALCGMVRARMVTCPLVVLGAPPEASSGLVAAGATECLGKPFRLSLLVARLQARLREPAADVGRRIGSFDFHPNARVMVDGGGRRISLTEKETAILSYLHQAGDRVVPREELLGEVWGYAGDASTHTVETHIYRLRRKLVGDTEVVVTEAGGYRLR